MQMTVVNRLIAMNFNPGEQQCGGCKGIEVALVTRLRKEKNTLEREAGRQTDHLLLIAGSVVLIHGPEHVSPYAGFGIPDRRDRFGAGWIGGKLQFDNREWILFD